MKYQITACTDIEVFPFTDNDGRVLFFPNKREAERFVDKFADMFLYNEDTDSYDIIIEDIPKKYTDEEATTLVKFLLDLFENS